MREQLIRYLLGELDADERRELRSQLRDNPELQRELSQLRECFAANQDDEEELPPGHLAERTADRISNSDEYELEAAIAAGPSSMSRGSDPPAGVLGWSLADLTVAGGVMLAVSMLVFPALRDSRDGMRSDICEDNLIQLYVLVTQHANDHGGRYPQVRPNEYTGVIPVQLVKKRYIEPKPMTVGLLCPASPRARELRAIPSLALFPTQEQLDSMTPGELSSAGANVPGCYGFRQPQYVGNDYFDFRELPTVYLTYDPIFGDMPGDPKDPMTPVHRGSIVQLMNRDGRVIELKMGSSATFGIDSDLYHNCLGVVAAGIGPHDVVLAPPNAMPGLATQER
jgi:hypothetical protein